jgi:hypothetical protein
MGNAFLNTLSSSINWSETSPLSIWVGVNIIGINLEGWLHGSGAAGTIGLRKTDEA